MLNYYYTANTNECKVCNAGCANCTGIDKNCVEAQHYWRRVPKVNEETENYKDAEFEVCGVDYCQRCDSQTTSNQNLCDDEGCAPGYTKYVFLVGELETQIEKHECAKCQDHCLQCESNNQQTPYNRNKLCTECNPRTAYMDNGVCREARAHCLQWEMTGGMCLQCSNGYRLNQGWCYSCFNAESGFKYCPSGCDSETGLTSNCRNAAQVLIDNEKDNEKNPVPTDPV